MTLIVHVHPTGTVTVAAGIGARVGVLSVNTVPCSSNWYSNCGCGNRNMGRFSVCEHDTMFIQLVYNYGTGTEAWAVFFWNTDPMSSQLGTNCGCGTGSMGRLSVCEHDPMFIQLVQ
ncbi:hypothetical protein AVEN_242189-1 [Araneus ventricosus]|uniref:Uncharacterized protein n=1 Tax=Araneus ventricosus TaxID=182803 RepID=A0A4Y2DED0_ARAVE|nr:hypothetical protein AVEN_242189-1 [Araneus ventricosus]